MSRSLSPFQAIVLAVVVLIGLILGGVALFTVGGKQNLFDGFVLHARFQDAQRVAPGTRVYIQGMDAGEVATVELSKNGEVHMKLRLAGKYRRHITKGSRVQIAGEGLFGGKILRILPNHNTSKIVAEGAVLREQPGGDLVAGIKRDIKQEIDNIKQDLKKSIGGPELQKAVAKLNKVLGHAERALTEFNNGKGPIGSVVVQLKKATGTLNKAVGKADSLLTDVHSGKGTLGKLIKDDDVYTELLNSLRATRLMIASVKQNSDALKAMPFVSGYVVDINKILNRPDQKRFRMYFAEKDLFQPGRAILTKEGQTHLDAAGKFLNEHKEDGSEVVIAAFADPKLKPGFAQMLTRKQSEAVAEYLKNTHQVHRTGWWWWSTRTVLVVASGNVLSPVPEKKKLPTSRIEIIVFVPQKS